MVNNVYLCKNKNCFNTPMDDNRRCRNCDAELQGRYCHACGQKSVTGRFTMRSLLHNLLHGIFHCDRNILYTYYDLFTRPGKMIAGYLEGRRIRYINPFTMLVIMSGIVTVFSEILLAEHLKSAPAEASGTVLSRLWHHLEALKDSPVFFTIVLVLLFTLAAKFIVKWIQGKRQAVRYNYTELLIAGVYIACQCLAVYLLVEMPLHVLLGKEHLVVDHFILFYFVFLVWDCKQLFQLPVKKSILFVFLCCLAVIVAFILLVGLLALLAVIFGWVIR
jgi:hypothetical protein